MIISQNKLYKLVKDDDGHTYAVSPDMVERVDSIFEKEWDDWTEEEQTLIDTLKQLDGGDEFFIILKSDLL